MKSKSSLGRFRPCISTVTREWAIRGKAWDVYTSSSDNPGMHLKHGCDLQLGRREMWKWWRRGGHHPCLGPAVLAGDLCLQTVYIPSQERWTASHDHDMGRQVLWGYRISHSEHKMAITKARSTHSSCSSALVYGRCSLGNLIKHWIKFTQLTVIAMVRTPTDTFSLWKSCNPVKLSVSYKLTKVTQFCFARVFAYNK